MGQCNRDECVDEQEELEYRLTTALDKLREVAAECAECGGTGLKHELIDPAWPHKGVNVVECPACQDIHDVINDCGTLPLNAAKDRDAEDMEVPMDLEERFDRLTRG